MIDPFFKGESFVKMHLIYEYVDLSLEISHTHPNNQC